MNIITLTNPLEISRLHFNIPTQVLFRHEEDVEGEYSAGIAHNTDIICLCCGGIIPLDEVEYLRYCPDEWVDLSWDVWKELCEDKKERLY